jgi:hypothetical protein
VPDTATGDRLGVLRARFTEPGRVLPVTLPVLAVVLAGLLVHTHGYHIDLEVYRLGVATWLAGGDMYGPLPPTISGLALPFIYPPFAAMVLLPLEVLPWPASPSPCTSSPGGSGRPVAGVGHWPSPRPRCRRHCCWNRCSRRSSSARSTWY